MISFAWLIPLFPLLSFLVLILSGKKLKTVSGYLASLLTGISFIFTLGVIADLRSVTEYEATWTWLTIGTTDIQAGVWLNPLNGLMLFIVSFVSLLVHIYSLGYMGENDRRATYFAYLGLFTFAMLGLVMSPNLIQFYMFWELVGLGSFLLIGFYLYKESAKRAARKAFIMTRIGDAGLLVGLILIFWQTGSLSFTEIFQAVEQNEFAPGMVTLTAILLFIGAVGKSGQFPLHTWLPDAMEGPTPVSALIHAATMVAAGVYLVAAAYPLFLASEWALMIVAVTGAFTAIFAATIGLVQDDLKRVLAYSTVSQLGYMMLALGAGGYVAGMFHLTTHAFFKALLFLAAGSVILALRKQNIKEIAGEGRHLAITKWGFLAGTLAISGFPLLSGSFSKEAIFAALLEDGQYGLLGVALLTAFLTSVYMFRLYFMVFHGKGADKPPKSVPVSMKIPVIILAALAVISGFFATGFADWLAAGQEYAVLHHSPTWLIFLATLLSLGGIVFAYFIYVRKQMDREEWKTTFSSTYTILYHKYFIDEFYQNTIIYSTRAISYLMYYTERYVVETIAAFAAGMVKEIGKTGSRLQNGRVQTYGTVALLGLAVIVLIFVVRGGYF